MQRETSNTLSNVQHVMQALRTRSAFAMICLHRAMQAGWHLPCGYDAFPPLALRRRRQPRTYEDLKQQVSLCGEVVVSSGEGSQPQVTVCCPRRPLVVKMPAPRRVRFRTRRTRVRRLCRPVRSRRLPRESAELDAQLA